MSDDAKAKADAAPVDENPEEAAKKKKKKLLIFAILGAVLLLGGGAGAFMFLSKGKKDVKEEEISKESAEHGEAKKDDHGDGHGDAKKDDHGDAKKDDHGDAKKDDHGAAKKDDHGDGHGDAKKDEHGDAKKDDHGEVKKDEHGNEIKAEVKEEKKVESNIDFGETYKMQTFNLNLGGMENRYIRIEISLEYKGGAEQKKEMEVRLPQLRDAIIGILQRKTREFLLSPDGKESLRKELLIRINRYMTKKIESVYITDLLIE
ncbi:MAG: flagellar basal body-associated FliL family protein [Bdellovibrionota bacterium]